MVLPGRSGFYATEVVGRLRTPSQVLQWNISRPDPSGLRHWESGVYKPAAKGFPGERKLPDGLRGGFTAQLESGAAINFGEILVDNSGFLTNTVALTFNLGEVNGHPDSFFDIMNSSGSVGTNFKAFGLRFWLNNFSAFDRNPSGIPIFYFLTSADWQRDLSLTPTTQGIQIVPSSLPSSQNLFSKDDNVFVSGAYLEQEFSHYLYIVGSFPSGVDYGLGTYGGLGSGIFTFRFSYDWSGIDANVRSTDII